MADLHDTIDADLPRYREELFDLLRIPSVSAKSEHDADTRRAAEWLADNLRKAGLSAEVRDTEQHPVVLAEWREAGDDAPTVLIYGHYDVQPPEPLDEWKSEPFEPDVRDGRIYGRGTADDKGQLFMHVKALEAHLKAHGSLPVNVVVVVEGEEEIGSPNLVPFVEENREWLGADVVLISDTGMFEEGLPTLGFSLRGLAYFEIRARGAASDLHSGEYGGAVGNAGNAIAKIVASLHDEQGRIAVEGFYDDVVEWDEATRQRIRDLPFDPEQHRREIGSPGDYGEDGYSVLERLWARPTCDVNGMLSGYTGQGAKTVLPAKAMAKVSFRLVADQDPDRVETLLRKHIEGLELPGVEVEVEALHGGRPWRTDPQGPFFEAADRALEAAFGREPVAVGGGGSIPIVGDFERILGAPVLLVGFSLPGANLHAPNEWLPVDNFEKGIHALANIYEELGGVEDPDPDGS